MLAVIYSSIFNIKTLNLPRILDLSGASHLLKHRKVILTLNRQ